MTPPLVVAVATAPRDEGLLLTTTRLCMKKRHPERCSFLSSYYLERDEERITNDTTGERRNAQPAINTQHENQQSSFIIIRVLTRDGAGDGAGAGVVRVREERAEELGENRQRRPRRHHAQRVVR
jgi:hypothetical protein